MVYLPSFIIKNIQLPNNSHHIQLPNSHPTLEEAIDPTAELPRFNLGLAFWVVEDESFAESGRTSSAARLGWLGRSVLGLGWVGPSRSLVLFSPKVALKTPEMFVEFQKKTKHIRISCGLHALCKPKKVGLAGCRMMTFGD